MRNVTILAACLSTASVSAAESNGEYTARISDRVACCTAEGDAAMTGGKKFPTPTGDTYSTNITPSKTQGVGSYSYEDFEKAVRQGIAKNGHPLYPVMPYPSYARLSGEDVRALYSYFMHGVTSSAQPNKENAIPWLLSARWSLHVWSWLFTDVPVMAVEGAKTSDNAALVKRGAYLMEGPGHYGSCYTPRGMAMNEKAYTSADAEYLNGVIIDDWYAPLLRGTGMSEQELKLLLLIGKSKHAAVSGSMAKVVTQSAQYLTDEDTTAIAQYLLSLESRKPEAVRVAATTASWSDSSGTGKVTYNRYCSTCHDLEGRGTDDNAPSLVDNPLVIADDPAPLFRVIVHGAEAPTTRDSVSFRISAYGGLLGDNEIHDMINYVRKDWGGGNSKVSQEGLAGVKKTSH